MKATLPSLLSALSLALLPSSATAAEPAAEAAPGKAVAALAGKLVVVEEGETKDYALKKEPEFYIVYHSASW